MIWTVTVAVLLIFWHPSPDFFKQYNFYISVFGFVFWFVAMPFMIFYGLYKGNFGKFKKSENYKRFYLVASFNIISYLLFTGYILAKVFWIS